jgi:hypothetical protein
MDEVARALGIKQPLIRHLHRSLLAAQLEGPCPAGLY